MSGVRFNTYVIETDSFKAVRVIGQNLGRDEATQMERSSGGSIDYFVQSYEVGSDRDLECVKDLKNLARKLKRQSKK